MRMEITYASTSSHNIAAVSASALDSSGAMPTRSVRVIPLQHPTTTSTSSSSSFTPLISRWRTKLRRMTTTEWIELFLPCYRWIRTYKWRDYLQADLMAGITVGIMLVPQSMSYAKLAGLDAIYGLYSGFVPIFVYAVFGSSRQLAIGPVALVSLLVSNVLGRIVEPSDELYTELAILLALMVGVFECILGLLRLGWIIRFISHSVISGFTTASAIVIALSQAKYFLGYSVVRSSKIIPLVKSIISGADQVGDIPQGLPTFSVPKEFSYVVSLIPTALLITGVAILESVGIAKALAAKNGYELDSNQEVVFDTAEKPYMGFQLCVPLYQCIKYLILLPWFDNIPDNRIGSSFMNVPIGSFSRSAVNHESGAKTGLTGIVMGIIMSCALLFMTQLFEYIPQCALAAIVVSAVIGLVDYDEAIFLWRVDKKDFLLWTITSATTLFLGIEIGVLVGVGFSLAFVIHESANPHIAVLGRLPGTTIYRNIQQYPEAYAYNGIVIVRIDAPIYFANISYIKDRLREFELEVDASRRHGPEVERVYFVVIEMAPVTYIDSSAVQALKDLHQEYRSRDIQVAISNPNREVLLTLAKSGVIDLIGKEWYFVRVHDAVQVCLQQVQSLYEAPIPPDLSPDYKSIYFHRLLKQRHEEFSNAELEKGISKVTDPQLEPLLSR
ncbi:hypothetical protein LguiA_035012 [Lonicera macranthoides]